MPGERILIIEDDPDTAQMLRLYLQLEGYDITVTNRGQDGLQKVSQLAPDMILLDIALPDISGWEVFQRLKNITSSPIILTTGFPGLADIAGGMGISENDFIKKPFDGKKLTEKIRTNLRQPPHLAEANPGAMVITRPVFGVPPRESQFRSDIFMIMPFQDSLSQVYDNHICPVARELALEIKRGDDFFSQRAIVSEIWGAIYAARLVIADCTGRNPNVFYELGIAHTLGKKVIMITQEKNDIPFDLQQYRYIQYHDDEDGLLRFQNLLRQAILKLLNP